MNSETGTIELKRRLRRELEAAVGKPCILCADRATNAHIWFPSDLHQSRHGVDADKVRVYVYGVCDRHDPNQMHLFESKEVIQQQIDSVILTRLGRKK